jgi:hypothetical protein
MQIYKNSPCFRCEDQAEGTGEWRAAGGKKKAPYPDRLKEMFPWDRAGYLLVDFSSPESIDKGWQFWAAPKENVHAEIAKKMHNKRKQTYIDVSDFVNGRIISLEVGERKTDAGDFPTYSIDFEELEEEISEELQDQLLEYCEEAEEAGFNLNDGGLIDYFLHFPEYEEVKKSHLTGMDKKARPVEEPEEEEEEEADGFDEEEIREELEEMSKFKIKKHAKKTWGIVIEDLKEKDKEEVIDEIIETLEEGGGRPDCYGNYGDFEACADDCDHDDECGEETEESME